MAAFGRGCAGTLAYGLRELQGSLLCCSSLLNQIGRGYAALQQQQAVGHAPQPQDKAQSGGATAESAQASIPLQAGSSIAYAPQRQATAQLSRADAQQGIIHVSNTANNILIALTDAKGDVKATSSAGQLGFRNARKSLPQAAERVADDIASKALKLGYSNVVVRLKGPGSNKVIAVQALHAAGLHIRTIIDATSIAYNGCRLPARRRV